MIEYLEADAGGYRPGVCNIGPEEIARRRRVGYVGLASAAALAAGLLLLDAPAATRLLVALPLAGGLSGLIQARLRFCAGYGWSGQRNLGRIGDAERVADADDRAADRRRSLVIYAASTGGGLALALLFALLPV
jgi:hypothetical protein